MWVVTRCLDSGWEEIVSRELTLPNHAREFAERQSRENLGKEFKVYRLVPEASYCSEIVTKARDTK